MARARNIKPAFFDNDKLAENDPLGRLLFIGLWTIADHNGNLEWRSKRIKVKLLPYDSCDIDQLAINLDKSGFVRFYSDGGSLYLNIPNFLAHQNPHKNEREKGTDIPDYSEKMRQAVDLKGLTINRDKSGLKQDDSSSDPADSLIPYPDSLNLNPDAGSQESGGRPPSGSDKFKPEDFVPEPLDTETWQTYCQFRRDLKKPIKTERAVKLIAKDFAKNGLTTEQAQACVEHSMKNEYQGLFPEKFAHMKTSQPKSFSETDYSKGVTEDGRLA